ncbi:MAG: hypothetical protein IPP06_12275 [Saprospiraceae bacterium]|nr:hypothetical protein [Candidatus Vicinibacter affinis]
MNRFAPMMQWCTIKSEINYISYFRYNCAQRLEIDAVAFYSITQSEDTKPSIQRTPYFSNNEDFCSPLLQSGVITSIR